MSDVLELERVSRSYGRGGGDGGDGGEGGYGAVAAAGGQAR
ncbi:hypothetical protein [Streptomyces sp. NPDC087300]